MSLILNEAKQAESILAHGDMGRKPTAALFLLGRYYRQKKQLNPSQTYEKLNTFMYQHYKNYNAALWEDTLENIARKADKYTLREINSVSVTKEELAAIAGLKNPAREKLLFAMLCHAKLYNRQSEKNDNWMNTDISTIFCTARVTVKHREDKFLYLNDLEKLGLISFSKKNSSLNIRVNIAASGEPELEITDFRELGYEYLNYLGEGAFIRCEKCGRLVRRKQKKDFSTKYCAQCKKEKTLEKYARYNKKRNLPLS